MVWFRLKIMVFLWVIFWVMVIVVSVSVEIVVVIKYLSVFVMNFFFRYLI